MGKSTKIAKKSWKMKQILSKQKKWKRKTVVASNTKCHECKLSMLFHVGRIKKRDGYEKVGWSVMMNRIKGATQHPSPITHTKQFPIISHFCGCSLLRFGSRFLPVHSNGQCGWEQILIVFICYAYWRDHSLHWKIWVYEIFGVVVVSLFLLKYS